MRDQAFVEEKMRAVLLAYGWRYDASSFVWWAPDGLPLPAIKLEMSKGIACWSTLDFQHDEIVEVTSESLEEYLAARQPYVRR